MTLQGHRRSLILTPTKSAYETSLLFYATFSMPTPIRDKILGRSPESTSVMLGSAESEP